MADTDKIRVLIVDDIAETRENIRKLLQFEPDLEVVGAAGTGRDGIAQARDLQPDVVIMDINMPDMDGIAATEAIRRHNSAIQIVILSVQGDSNYMRRAMLAGARDFLTKPPSVNDLTAAIRRAGSMAKEERSKIVIPAQQTAGGRMGGSGALVSQGKVISIYSPKGGSGCTMLAVNVAMTLHNDETPVVLVDGNLQFGDVAVLLNEQARNSVADLAPRADELDPEIVGEVLITHGQSGVKLLAAPARPEQAENINGDQFSKVIAYLRQLFPYVVVDLSTYLSDSTLAVLEASDIIILIATQDIPSIKNSRLFLDLVDALQIDRQRILLTMNRYDKRIGITAERIGESFKHEVAAVIPVEERVVVPSVNRGVPFMLGDRTRPIAKSVLSLAEAVRRRLTELSEDDDREPVATGRLGRR